MRATAGEDLYGSPAKIGLMRRSRLLWSLLRDDPRFAYYGRAVFVAADLPDPAGLLASVAGLAGAGISSFFPKSSAEKLFAELRAKGYSTDRHEHYRGDGEAYRRAVETVKVIAPPGGVDIVRIGPQTVEELLVAVVELWESCGVMPVPGSVMRGMSQPGIVLAAIDGEGRPVSVAASFSMHHANSKRASDVFWGMLATAPEWRGRKLGLLLGAQAIVHMWENEGARGFNTGVRSENRSSQALCEKLAVRDTDWVYAGCIDPELLGGNTVTR